MGRVVRRRWGRARSDLTRSVLYFKLIREIDQCLRFEGPVAPQRQLFASPEEAASHLAKALESGADIAGICGSNLPTFISGRTSVAWCHCRRPKNALARLSGGAVG